MLSRRAFSPRLVDAALLLAFAVALRWPWFGDPVAGLDEQFYLLVGDRMLHGALPYVDIWDRKPFGLFLIYAAVRLLPGNGVLAYQIVATLCLAATGAIAAAIAARFTVRPAALAAGAAVIGYGVLLGAGFGEPPAFHDLLTVSAVWLLLPSAAGKRVSLARSLAAMLACGVAITIKTNAALEGMMLGVWLVASDYRRERAIGPVLARASGYALAGLAPTLAIAAFYAAIGAFDHFWFANAVSILRKSGGGSADSMAGLVACLLLLTPLIGLAAIGASRIPLPPRLLLLAWVSGAALSFGAIGFFAFHYAMPLVTPLAILAAAALGRRAATIVLAGGTLTAAAALVVPSPATQDRTDIAALARLLPPSVTARCLFVHEGPAILYHLSHACLPGSYVFPGHFTDSGEAAALERPAATILRETLARRPAAIVTTPDRASADGLLPTVLRRDYRLAGSHPVRLYGNARITLQVWVAR